MPSEKFSCKGKYSYNFLKRHLTNHPGLSVIERVSFSLCLMGIAMHRCHWLVESAGGGLWLVKKGQRCLRIPHIGFYYTLSGKKPAVPVDWGEGNQLLLIGRKITMASDWRQGKRWLSKWRKEAWPLASKWWKKTMYSDWWNGQTVALISGKDLWHWHLISARGNRYLLIGRKDHVLWLSEKEKLWFLLTERESDCPW